MGGCEQFEPSLGRTTQIDQAPGRLMREKLPMPQDQREKGFWIRIFVPDGIPDGLRIVEKSNWTGRGLIWPRSLLADVKKQPDLDKTGVYILVGPPTESELPRVYIGEGDPMRPRIEVHAANKDFWTSTIAFTSKDDSLNKADVQHLESRLIHLASRSKRCELENANAPLLPSLSKADESEVNGFLDAMLLCFPVLGLDIFEAPREVAAGACLRLKGGEIECEGYETAKGFVVVRGSLARTIETRSIPKWLKRLRSRLKQDGVLVADGDTTRFADSYVFNSPSAAAGVLLGRSANGLSEWVDDHGRTLREIESGGTQDG